MMLKMKKLDNELVRTYNCYQLHMHLKMCIHQRNCYILTVQINESLSFAADHQEGTVYFMYQ